MMKNQKNALSHLKKNYKEIESKIKFLKYKWSN